MRAIIKIIIILILLINGTIISYCQNDSIKKDVFDVKNEKGIVLIDNPNIFISSVFIMECFITDKTIMTDEKDLKYNIGYIGLSQEKPMQSSKEEVWIIKPNNDNMYIRIHTLNAVVPCYYFKNLKFKKGHYELILTNSYLKTKLKGNKIDVSNRTKKILFKNIQVNGMSKNIHFNDIEFTIIDFNDTKNVHLIKK